MVPSRKASRRSAWALRLTSVALVSCACGQRNSSGSSPLSGDLRLAARVLVGEDGLWLVQVRESEQAGLDRNGDGDVLDDVLVLLDLERGTLRETGLALSIAGDRPPLLACDGQVAALAVDEAAQGATDLNGDGDAEDRVLFVLDRESGTFRNLALAVRTVRVGFPLVAAAVDEHDQGELDLDGDGDADGTTLAIHDLGDGSTAHLGLRDASPLLVRDGRVALMLSERPGLDLSLDGDDLDRTVFEVYDGRTRLLQNTTLVLAGTEIASAAGTFGVAVSEAGQGLGDLSGDGDTDDAVFHVYAPERGLSINLGLGVPFHPSAVTDGERYLVHAFEAAHGSDANGDQDLDDLVVVVFDPRTGLLTSSGLASQGAAVLAGAVVGIAVSEPMQGSLDLDGNGEANGNIVHVLDLEIETLQNLGLDSFRLLGTPSRLFLAPSEEAAQVDWNEDGDHLDQVLFAWDAVERVAHREVAILALLAANGDHALVSVREADRGGDENGDGDDDDLLLELLDARSGRSLPLGLAVGSATRLTGDLRVLTLVDEAAQGRDLNGDGDLADEVLHVLELGP